MPRRNDIQVGSASVKIVADKQGLKDGVDSGKKDLEGLAGSAELSMKRMKTAFIAAGGVAAAAIGAAMKEIAEHTISVSAEFERLEVKLNALTQGRGKETLEELNQWAIKMPVNTAKAVDVFSMMMATGLNPTIEKMTTLVDVSVLFGEDAMPRVARALGQMKSLGKLSAEELNQLSEAGINARKYLKEAFGMGVEELQKSGKDIDEIINAIMDGLKKEFGGAAADAQKTWAGVKEAFVSTLDEIARKGGESEGAFDGLKESVRGLTGYLEENKALFIDISKNSVELASSMVNLARDIADFVTPAIKAANDALGTWLDMAKMAGLRASGFDARSIKDVWAFEKDPELFATQSKIKQLREEITDFQNQIKNPTAFKIFKGEDAYLKILDSIEKKQQSVATMQAWIKKHANEKGIESDFDYFVAQSKQIEKNLADLSKLGGGTSPLERPATKTKATAKKETNPNAYADTMKELALHYREINNEISEQEKALMSVDAIVDRQKKDLLEIGVSEKEIAAIRAESHKRVLEIVAGQDELKKVVENVKKLEEDGQIYGDDYGTLNDGMKSQWETAKEIQDEIDEKIKEFEEKSGREFGRAMIAGMSGGLDSVWDELREGLVNTGAEMIGQKIGDSISAPMKEALQKSFSGMSEEMAGKLGGAVSGVAGGVIGAGIGMVTDAVFGGGGPSRAEQIMDQQKELIKEINENTAATRKNTEFLRSGEKSSYSAGLFDISNSLDDARKNLLEQMRDLENPIEIFDIGDAIDDMSGLTDLINALKDPDIDIETLQSLGEMFGGAAVGLEAMTAELESFAAKIDDVQKGIVKSARDMWTDAGDAFRTDDEILKIEMEETGKDLLTGLAESFQLEGVKLKPRWEEVFGMMLPFDQVIDDAYITDLSKLGSVQEISQKLLADLVPGTDAYNQAMETSLLIYETARLKQEALNQSLTEGLTSSVSDWKTSFERRGWGLSEWSDEFETIGRSIEGLNVLSDSYFSDAVELAEKQFDALQQIASFSEAQLAELKSSSRSLEDQLWDLTKGGGADTTGIDDWMKRGETLYWAAEKSLSAEDISAFQSYIPELKDAMLASGYSASYVNDQLEWALSTLLEKVNRSMDGLSSTIDKLPGLAPTLQPIQISLNVDGKVLSNVIIDQLNTNTNLVNAVRKAV